MASYKYEQYLKTSQSEEFDTTHQPGDPAPYAGVYRCHGCGYEIGTAAKHKLPPQDHHTHSEDQGKIRWRLVVFAMHKKS